MTNDEPIYITMKINPTVILTLTLLGMMFGAGSVSARWGLKLGTDALKEITQPEISPTSKREGSQKGLMRGQGIVFLQEKNIVKNIRAIMDGKVPAEPAKPKQSPKPAATKAPETAAKPAPAKNQPPAVDPRFPIQNQDDDVTLVVRSAKKEGDTLVLNVTLKNNGTRPVQFLYSFLSITDEGGKNISATTEGLPSEVPSDGKVYGGKVNLPISLLENAKKLSLSLTDYPDRQVELKIDEIPVVR